MHPKFWKVSHGTSYFSHEAILDALNERLVYVHKDTAAKGTSQRTQGVEFNAAPIGDYFYLTHGNTGIYVLGQFSSAANVFSKMRKGRLDRPYRHIKSAISRDVYSGPHKRWAPNDNSTFTPVPDREFPLFEAHILKPYFGITLAEFEIE